MRITVSGVRVLPDGGRRVEFTAAHGRGAGIWCMGPGREPLCGEVYHIELTLLDAVQLGENAQPSSCREFGLWVEDNAVAMTTLVEGVDPDHVAYFRLGSDGLFMSDIAGSGVETGRWVDVRIAVARLELHPYDSAMVNSQ